MALHTNFMKKTTSQYASLSTFEMQGRVFAPPEALKITPQIEFLQPVRENS